MSAATELDALVQRFARQLLPSERPKFFRLVKALQAEAFQAGIDQASTNLVANLESDSNVSREFVSVMRNQSRRLLHEFDAADEWAKERMVANAELSVGTPERT